MQTRKASLVESLTNIAVGYAINFAANMLIFPLFGWQISARQAGGLGAVFTAIALARSFTLRRLFNWLDERKEKRQ